LAAAGTTIRQLPDSGAPDLPRFIEDAKGGGGWVVLCRAADDIEAHLITGRLTEAGIETDVLKDRGRPGDWVCIGSDPWAPSSILVRRIQLEDARIVMAEVALSGPDAPPPPDRLGEAPSWKGTLRWWTAALALGLAFTALGLAQAAQDLERRGTPRGSTSSGE
jgi:hypothetical protein